jgi:hypothetical protein
MAMSKGKGALVQHNKHKEKRNKHEIILNKCKRMVNKCKIAINTEGRGIYQKQHKTKQKHNQQ